MHGRAYCKSLRAFTCSYWALAQQTCIMNSGAAHHLGWHGVQSTGCMVRLIRL